MNISDRFAGSLLAEAHLHASAQAGLDAQVACPASFLAGISYAELCVAQTIYAVAARAAVERVAREAALARAVANN